MDSEPDVSPPPARASRRLVIAATAAVTAAVIGVAGMTVRLPAYSFGPGPARDVQKLLHVQGRPTSVSEGRFLLTTVAVSSRPITVFEGIRAWLDPAISVVERSAVIQPGLDDRRQDLLNRDFMEGSKYAAEVVAMRAVGESVPEMRGARVMTVLPDTPAVGVLQPGDVIVAVDGAPVGGPDDLSAQAGKHAVGDAVSLDIVREGKRESVRLATIASPFEQDARSFGVTVRQAFRLPFEVGIDTEDIGGPSGGLVFTIALIDALIPEDLTRGHTIAATGTISLDGSVGNIGGIEEKVLAAEHARADVLIVPAEQEAAAARAAGTRLRVLGVRTAAEALADLRSLAEGA